MFIARANSKHLSRGLFVITLALLASTTVWIAGCQHGGASTAATAAISTVHLESFIVNLADNDGRSYLRVGIDLGIEAQNAKSRAGQEPDIVPVIRDSVIALLSTLKSDDLLTSDGKKKLKQELIKSLNDRLPELKVREVYFNEFMVQR
jgi:flagellar FliL protein